MTRFIILAALPMPVLAADPDQIRGEYVHAVAFSSNGKLFAATQSPSSYKPDPGKVAVFDTKTWERTRLLDGPKSDLRTLVFVPGQMIIVAGSMDGTIHM